MNSMQYMPMQDFQCLVRVLATLIDKIIDLFDTFCISQVQILSMTRK